MEEIRLQKYLAEAGLGSRRKCEEYIEQGRVKVNGKIACIGMKVNTKQDIIVFDNEKITETEEHIYILLNKPIGYVTTVKEQFNRDSVLDLVKVKQRIVPVGRLDMYTSGALLLSNDGEFIYKITHPKHEIDKTYIATVKGIISDEEITCLKNGVKIDNEYITKPAKVKILKIDEEKCISRIAITIHEGKNRQVRKMCESIGRTVQALHRSKIGNIDVKELSLGTWRYLRPEEIKYLMK